MGWRQVTDLWVSAAGGLVMGQLFFFCVVCGLWGSVIKGGHGWWSPAWEASLASLLA